MLRYSGFLLMALLLGITLAVPLRADEAAQAGRTVANQWKDTLVLVKITAKVTISFEDQTDTQDIRSTVAGVVIDPSGMIITSLSSIDPTGMMGQDEDGMEDVSTAIEISSLKVALADGTEVPGTVVLRDRDLDTLFIRLQKKPEKPLLALDLTKASQPELLDQVVVLSRLGSSANRTLYATVDRVQAVIEKPRKVYVLGMFGYAADYGSPVFALDGKIIGIQLQRVSTLTPNESDAMDVSNTILPAADIAAAVAQIPTDQQ